MSCATLQSQSIQLVVTAGNLPEGYCPATFQQFLNDLAARLIVTPNVNNSTFVTGSVAPTTNQGPWLKNCEEWFVFDDATGTYVPMTKIAGKGFSNAELFTANGTFTVPDFVYKLKVHAWGGGGGGSASAGGIYGGGGGAGGYGMQIFTVTPGQSIGYTVGAGGTSGGNPAGSGTSSTFLTLTANGGTGGFTDGATQSIGGNGGTATGAILGITGQGGSGAASGNIQAGQGGCAAQGGGGGMFSAVQANADGHFPGGGGAGATSGTGPVGLAGVGGAGAILVEY